MTEGKREAIARPKDIEDAFMAAGYSRQDFWRVWRSAWLASEAHHRMALAEPQVRERWRHVKRGTVYEVIGEAELQNANTPGLREGAALTVYRGDDGKLWAREEGEFYDGRFERLTAAPASEPQARAGGDATMKYAVAVTLSKPIPGGSNIVTRLNIYEAVSDAEARGLAFTAASDANPEHEVFRIAIVPVETQPEASRSPASEPQALSEERAWNVLAQCTSNPDRALEVRGGIAKALIPASDAIRAMIRFATETQKGSGE